MVFLIFVLHLFWRLLRLVQCRDGLLYNVFVSLLLSFFTIMGWYLGREIHVLGGRVWSDKWLCSNSC